MVGAGILFETISVEWSCLMLWQQRNSNSTLVLPRIGSCFRLACIQEQALLPSALLFVLLPETKLPAPLLSRLLGFGPAGQVAAGTQMKEPSQGRLWQSAQPSPAQPRPGSPGPSCRSEHPATTPAQGSLCEFCSGGDPCQPTRTLFPSLRPTPFEEYPGLYRMVQD